MMDEPDDKKRRALEFARRLINRRSDLGLSQSNLALRASDHLPDSRSFSRASISRYESGENVPGPSTLAALAKVLQCEPADLVPSRRALASPRAPLALEQDPAGNVKLSIDQVVPFDVAMKIIALLPKAQ